MKKYVFFKSKENLIFGFYVKLPFANSSYLKAPFERMQKVQ